MLGANVETARSVTTKKIYLDTFAFVKIAADDRMAEAARKYLVEGGWELVVGTLNLQEIYSWPSCWSSVATFISSVPFCIARNSDRIADAELASYPAAISLPIGFRSLDHCFSSEELGRAIEHNMRLKIASFNGLKGSYEQTLQALIEDRDSFPPASGRRHSPVEKFHFLHKAVFAMLSPRHLPTLRRLLNSQGPIEIERFRSVYIQALAVFLEYHVQRKPGKPSDVGDICQLALLPYVDQAVLDNERSDLVIRLNREEAFQKLLSSCRMSEFVDMINAA